MLVKSCREVFQIRGIAFHRVGRRFSLGCLQSGIQAFEGGWKVGGLVGGLTGWLVADLMRWWALRKIGLISSSAW